jgi:hypothetical protein
LDWIVEFIAPYTFPQFGTTGNYSVIADEHTSQFTVAHAVGFSAFTSRILATDFHTVSLALKIAPEVFIAPPHSFLATSQSSLTNISRTRPNYRPITVLYFDFYCPAELFL